MRPPGRGVRQDGDISRLQDAPNGRWATPVAHRVRIVPPIMVAEDRKSAERRAQTGQDTDDIRHGDPTRDEAMMRWEIAEHDVEVRRQRIGRCHDTLHAAQLHPGLARVQIRRDADREGRTRAPTRHRNGMLLHHQAEPRLDRHRVACGGGNQAAAGREKFSPGQERHGAEVTICGRRPALLPSRATASVGSGCHPRLKLRATPRAAPALRPGAHARSRVPSVRRIPALR